MYGSPPAGAPQRETAGVLVAGNTQSAGATAAAPHPQGVRGGQTAGDNGERGTAVKQTPVAIEQTATVVAAAAAEAAHIAGAGAVMHRSRNYPSVMSSSRGSMW